MDLALATAAARTPDVIELGAGNIGGMTLAPHVYRWSTGLSIPLDLELVGNVTLQAMCPGAEPREEGLPQLATDVHVSGSENCGVASAVLQTTTT